MPGAVSGADCCNKRRNLSFHAGKRKVRGAYPYFSQYPEIGGRTPGSYDDKCYLLGGRGWQRSPLDKRNTAEGPAFLKCRIRRLLHRALEPWSLDRAIRPDASPSAQGC